MSARRCKFALKLLADRPRVRYVCLVFNSGRIRRWDSIYMIMSYLLRKIFPWIVEISLWLMLVAGAVMGHESNYLGSATMSALLGAAIGFFAGVIPLGMLQTMIRNNILLESMAKDGYGRPRLSLHKGQVVEMPYVSSEDQL